LFVILSAATTRVFGSPILRAGGRGVEWICCLPSSVTAPRATHGRHNVTASASNLQEPLMIRKLQSGEYRLYSRKKDPKTGKKRNLGTFATREKAEAHERAVQYFKRH
jgi:hypothetical protein